MLNGVNISVNENGLFRLNDIHNAAKAGGIVSANDESKRPGDWFKTAKAKSQIGLENDKISVGGNHPPPFQTLQGGTIQGTWANKRLALKYAAWISVEFEDHVYDVFEAYLDKKLVPQNTQQYLTSDLATQSANNMMSIMDIYGVPKHIALIETTKVVHHETGYDLSPMLQYSKHMDNIEENETHLEVTELGKKYAIPHAWKRGNKSGYNLKWNVKFFENIFINNPIFFIK